MAVGAPCVSSCVLNECIYYLVLPIRYPISMRFPVVFHEALYTNGSFEVATDVGVPRFEPGPEALAYLQREGYVVIKNANEDEVRHARELLWAYHEGTGTGARRDRPETWIRNQPNQYGIFWGFGAGHSRLAWFVRTRPKLLRMFELVWNTSDLITSFEGFSMFPPERVESKWRLGESWFHTDQNHKSRPGLQTIQSFTSLCHQPWFSPTLVFRGTSSPPHWLPPLLPTSHLLSSPLRSPPLLSPPLLSTHGRPRSRDQDQATDPNPSPSRPSPSPSPSALTLTLTLTLTLADPHPNPKLR